MAKKFFPRALSVGLSLAMCAGMVAPAFAASFKELQDVIDTKESLYAKDDEGNNTDEVRIGYDGGTVTLYEKVERGEDDAASIVVDEEVTIDLNGNDIDGNGKTGSVITVTGEDASLTLKDSTAETVTDDEGKEVYKSGAVTGGKAEFGGGVKVEHGAEFTMESGKIADNHSPTSEGGGVYVVDGSKFTMNGGEISGNTAKNNGGGVFVANYSQSPYNEAPSQFIMNGGKISGNVTGDDTNGAGGGVGAYGNKQDNDNVAVTINDGEITGNSTGANGGGIAVQNGALTMTGGTVSNNTVKNASGNGSGIYSFYSDVSIKNGTEIKNNTGAQYGGGIYASVGGSLTVEDSIISGNGAGYGGGVYVGGVKDATIKSNKITGNDATYGGGLAAYNSTIGMSGNNISNNNTSDRAGGVYADSGNGGATTINMDGDTISGNTTTKYGGGIYTYGANTTVNANGTTISGNKGASHGGGIAAFGGKLTITGGEISGHSVTTSGGGIYAQTAGTEITMDDVSITGNSVTAKNGTGGGVRLASGAALTMLGGIISGNTAISGAGVYSYNGATFTMNGGEITGNTAAASGGGVFNYTASFLMNSGKLYGNTAKGSGDDIYNDITNGGSISLIVAEDMGAKIDGETIDRWLWDAADARYKDNNYLIPSLTENAVLCLKAAPSQFFTVTVSNGYNDELILNEKLERNTAFPTIDDPTREGYTFTGWSMELPELVNGEINLVAQWEMIPVIEDPIDPVDPADTEEEVDDVAVPLASGPITRAQFIDYLWRHEGEPASDGVCTFTDVPEDHEFILALAWAEQNGVAVAYADGSFAPDELVTTDAVREFLGSFAQVFGTNAISVGELTTLSGEAGEAVLNCDEVLAEFFGEEYTPAEADGVTVK